jgi:hypothetical protein
VLKTSPPPIFDPRTLQPVASHYTDYAIQAHKVFGYKRRYNNFWQVKKKARFIFLQNFLIKLRRKNEGFNKLRVVVELTSRWEVEVAR